MNKWTISLCVSPCRTSLVNQTLFVARRLSIGDYKRPLRKGLVYCLYLFRSRNIQILYMLIGVKKYTSKTYEEAMYHGFRSGRL